jgi:tetratricopeptide (TPR) repeat protein
VQLATAYQRLRQPANGERLFEEAREAIGDNANFYRFAARYYGMRYETDKAAEAIREVLKRTAAPTEAGLAGERFALYSSLIFNLAHSGKTEEVRKVLEQAQGELGDLDPDEMKTLRIDALTQLEQYDEAIPLVREQIDSDPENPDLYYTLGGILNEAGRIDEAERALRRALELIPDPPRTAEDIDLRATVLNHLGYMFAEEGIKLQEAEQLLQQALKLAPRAGFIVDSMGWAQFKLGDFQEAVRLLKKAIDYSSEDPVLYDHLGDVYAKLGDKTQALECYQQALRLDPTLEKIRLKVEELSGHSQR